MPWRKRALRRSAGRIQEFVEIGHRMDRGIGTWTLACRGMLHPTKRLTLQNNPRTTPFFEVVGDLHPTPRTPRRSAGLRAKLDLGVRLIAGNRNTAHIHVHRAHVERADRRQVLQNPRANGGALIRLLFAGAQTEEGNRQEQGQGDALHEILSKASLTANDFLFQAAWRPFGTNGKLLRRMPVASNSALPTAGAIVMMGVSPAPADGMSFRSRSTASISGTSRKRGTRYAAKCGFVMRPFSNSTASKSAPPNPWMIAPTT